MIEPFKLDATYLQLADGADVTPLPVGDDFWRRLADSPNMQAGRLVTFFHLGPGNVHWEMHPGGDEVLFLISGAMAVVLDDGKAERRATMKAGDAFVVPRGTWHKFEILAGGDLLAITRGAGTEFRDG